MKYALRGITAEEISYTMNKIKVDKDTRFEIKPQFTRSVKKVKENDKLHFLVLEVKIEGKDDAPTPFNLKCRLVGAFEAEEIETEEDRQVLVLSMTEIVYPYLRSTVAALTANAFISPVTLPVVPITAIFPEQPVQDGETVS
jgi:preprotein translocase subunit SecB